MWSYLRQDLPHRTWNAVALETSSQVGGATVSLFDGIPERAKLSSKRTKSKSTSLPKRKKRTESTTTTEPKKISRDERRRITQAYERGELKFADTSAAFALCHCSMYPEFHSYPHAYHTNELARFELEHYERKK